MRAECDREDFWQQEIERYLPDPAAALEEALGYVSCPICYPVSRRPFEYFAELPRRWLHESRLREVVSHAGGFCTGHTWRFFRMQSHVAIARVMADVLEHVSPEPRAQARCPVCELQRRIEETMEGTLLQWLTAPEARERYGQRMGVCLRHYDRLLGRDLSAPVRETLVQTHVARCRELTADLRAHIAKNTIEAKWTRTEAENRAPRRALLMTGGTEDA